MTGEPEGRLSFERFSVEVPDRVLADLQYADAHGFDVLTDEVERDGTRRLTLRRVR